MNSISPSRKVPRSDRATAAVASATGMELSPGQLSFWLAQMLDHSDPSLNIGECVEILGAVDPIRFEEALRSVVGATDALHLQIFDTDQGPRQRFRHVANWAFPLHDFSFAPDPPKAARAWMQEDMGRAFRLNEGPLYRFALLKISPDRFFFYAVNHHIINDGVGWKLMLARVAAAYTSLAAGLPLVLEHNGSYADLLAEERNYRSSDQWRRDRDFWKTELADLPPRATLSGKPAQRPHGFIRHIHWLERSLDLDAAGRRRGTSAAAVLLGATAIYLNRVLGIFDMLIAIPVTARVGPKMRSTVGMAANALPVRISLAPGDGIDDAIARVGRAMRTAMRHQRYRYEDIRRDFGLGPRDGEMAGTFVNYMPLDDSLKFGDAPILCDPLGNWWVEDLQIVFYGGNHPSGLRLDFIANPECYDQQEIARHAANFTALLTEIVGQDANVPIGSLPMPWDVSPSTAAWRPAISRRRNETSDDLGPHRGGHPQTPTEVALAEIWRDVLRCGPISRDDDFFDNGGDSLLANLLMMRVRKVFAVELPLGLVFEASSLSALARHVDAYAKEHIGSPPVPEIARLANGEPAVLSFSQHRMWLIQSLDRENTAYNMSGALKLTGDLDVDALTQALGELVRRHEILRTTYDVIGEDVVQLTHEWKREPLKIIDLTADFPSPEAEALRRANLLARTPIDLAKGPVFRCSLMRIGPDEHLLHMTVHHIAGDQWSFGVMGRDLAKLYNAARRGAPIKLPPLPIRYRDFASWQRKLLETAEVKSQIEYWRRTLRDVPALDLPTDRPRPRVQTLRGTFSVASIPPKLLQDLEQLGHREGTTLFMTMFAGFVTLLHRLAGQSDIPVGVPVANRTHSAVENIVGTFVNTVVLRADLAGDPSFSDMLGRVRETALNAFAHQDAPFDKLVQEIVPTRDTSRAPLVQVLFNMLNVPMHGIDLDGVAWEPVLIDRGGAQFELSVSIDPQVSKTISVEYNTDLFDRATIDRFIERYFRLLECAAEEPGHKLSELDVLPLKERQLVLDTWNPPRSPAERQAFIHTFEARAAQSANEPAVTFEGVTLSYGELNARANLLARELRRNGAERRSLVGVCLDRSLNMLAALLAVQKSGAAYVPLDPKLPRNRLRYMIEDSGLALLISADAIVRDLELETDVTVIDPQTLANEPASGRSDIECPASASDPAYVIYTSGSTGKPKGVVVSHGSLANFLSSMQNEPGIRATDVLAAVTTSSFDIAALELYLPLMAGARIELASSATASDGAALSELLTLSGATMMQATPATWRMLLDAGWTGGSHFTALCGGEALSPDLAEALLRRVGALWNLYGPTETTIWSTISRVEPGETPISIGKPIENTQVYVLNGDEPAPIGITGEICIGGDGVAAGYHRRPELTAERFRPDPFAPESGARMYRTGDLGRWGADGRLYHMGRADHQVKVRGFRIELGEIESVLLGHPDIREAVVVVHDAGASDKRLVAYVTYTGSEEPTVSDMRRYLRQHLPDYMVPSLFVALDRLPLTPNGKVDRNRLPDPFSRASMPAQHGCAATPTETFIANLWRDLLKIDRVDPEDNFFDLGGHSLLALRFVGQIEKRLGVRLDPRTLFFQNLRQIAARLPDVEAALQ